MSYAYVQRANGNNDGDNNAPACGFEASELLAVTDSFHFSAMLMVLIISNPYALKDSGPTSDMTAWTSAGLQPTTGYYPYDPTLAAYG
uniref:Uncharacterized protein n=1 Tax=Anopheles epiroticus TaxID=199890 RepID=A0A182PBC6_9DIPT